MVANKIDLPSAVEGLKKLQKHLSKDSDYSIIPISALTGEGLSQLIYSAYELLQNNPIYEEEEPQSEVIEYNYEPVYTIEKKGSKFFLSGKAVRRAVLMTDMENEMAVIMLHNKLKKMGIVRALARSGAKEGDRVEVDGVEFTFTT